MILSEDEWKSQPGRKVWGNFLLIILLPFESLLCRLDTAAESGAANTGTCASSKRGKVVSFREYGNIFNEKRVLA